MYGFNVRLTQADILKYSIESLKSVDREDKTYFEYENVIIYVINITMNQRNLYKWWWLFDRKKFELILLKSLLCTFQHCQSDQLLAVFAKDWNRLRDKTFIEFLSRNFDLFLEKNNLSNVPSSGIYYKRKCRREPTLIDV